MCTFELPNLNRVYQYGLVIYDDLVKPVRVLLDHSVTHPHLNPRS